MCEGGIWLWLAEAEAELLNQKCRFDNTGDRDAIFEDAGNMSRTRGGGAEPLPPSPRGRKKRRQPIVRTAVCKIRLSMALELEVEIYMMINVSSTHNSITLTSLHCSAEE